MTNGPLCGPFVFGASAAGRAAPGCATWHDDRSPGSYFSCLLESGAEFFSIFNRSTNSCPTSNAGFCPVISSRSPENDASPGRRVRLSEGRALAGGAADGVVGTALCILHAAAMSLLSPSDIWMMELLMGCF